MSCTKEKKTGSRGCEEGGGETVDKSQKKEVKRGGGGGVSNSGKVTEGPGDKESGGLKW